MRFCYRTHICLFLMRPPLHVGTRSKWSPDLGLVVSQAGSVHLQTQAHPLPSHPLTQTHPRRCTCQLSKAHHTLSFMTPRRACFLHRVHMADCLDVFKKQLIFIAYLLPSGSICKDGNTEANVPQYKRILQWQRNNSEKHKLREGNITPTGSPLHTLQSGQHRECALWTAVEWKTHKDPWKWTAGGGRFLLDSSESFLREHGCQLIFQGRDKETN